MKEVKYCNKCGIELVLGDNWANCNQKQRQYTCKNCKVAYYSQAHILDNTRKRHKEARIRVLSHYGKCRCACCNENRLEFLAIDHINGNGNRHRKENNIGSGTPFYGWLIRNNYPSGFRVLCHNCNMCHGMYGYCVHQKENKGPLIKQIPMFAGMLQQYK